MTERFALLAQRRLESTASNPTLGIGLETFLFLVGAIVFGGVGVWLMLPPGSRRRMLVGGVTATLGLVLLSCQMIEFGVWDSRVLFWFLAGMAIISATATITMRSPVYSAIWFALALLATAGLFLLQDAQFLSVATVIVYAGAILVTFLFVLMLAQPAGDAFYDRISWGPFVPSFATLCGALLVGALAYALSHLMPSAVRPNGMGDEHMARLGAQLFSRQLIGVEVAGTLLLIALVGAIAIVIQSQDSRKAGQQTAETDVMER